MYFLMPQNEKISIFLIFLFEIRSRALFSKCPIFESFETFEPFLDSKMGHVKNFEHEKMGHFETKTLWSDFEQKKAKK